MGQIEFENRTMSDSQDDSHWDLIILTILRHINDPECEIISGDHFGDYIYNISKTILFRAYCHVFTIIVLVTNSIGRVITPSYLCSRDIFVVIGENSNPLPFIFFRKFRNVLVIEQPTQFARNPFSLAYNGNVITKGQLVR